MNNEKMTFNLAPGMEDVEITLREAPAAKVLDEKPPVKIDITGTIGAVAEWLEKRVEASQFSQKNCHILVDREKGEITLVTNEADEYKRGKVSGALKFNPAYLEFGINNSSVVWTPTELGMFLKMNRVYFPDRTENMKLVSTLMNFVATVNNSIVKSVKENGDRADNFSQAVDSNLPASFTIQIPVLKGGEKETIEVETFAKISGRDVSFILISPDAAALFEEIKETEIDKQLASIREIAPDIAIIEV